ncbi:hypothetical protein ACP26L_26630 [Paenibacillus sp. S-38]|uniref:hypothetical protein n=1 Tax=Paenibacillus sp. S-38 TaxID=3416710 RepID=UPI003CF43ECD
MFAQYFGQYLLSQGHLTSTQLYEALTAQKDARPKLGVLAINQGWMTGAQVEEVHAEQMSRDKRFGEIAVEQGYLTEEQVQELLLSQKSEHLLLGQTLIDQGLMTYESFSEVLSSFKDAYSLSDEQFSSILQGSVDALVSAVLLKDGSPAGEWLSGYVSLFAKNLIRFADSGVRLEMAIAPRPSVYDWVFSQRITAAEASEAGYTAIAGSQESMLRLASRFAQEPISSPDELFEAAAGELLNLHNGIFLVNMSDRGTELSMEPQHTARSIPEDTLARLQAIRIYGTDYEVDLLISDLTPLLRP